MDTMQVRSSERLDVDKLHAFLESHFLSFHRIGLKSHNLVQGIPI